MESGGILQSAYSITTTMNIRSRWDYLRGKKIFLEIKAAIPVLNLNSRLGQDFPQKGKRTSTMKIIMSENFPFDVSLVPEFCFQEINKKKLTKRGRLRK